MEQKTRSSEELKKGVPCLQEQTWKLEVKELQPDAVQQKRENPHIGTFYCVVDNTATSSLKFYGDGTKYYMWRRKFLSSIFNFGVVTESEPRHRL